MCFSPNMPAIPAPTAPPTVRDAVQAGVQKRQTAAGNVSDTNASGALGDTSDAKSYKAKLGA